MHRTAQWTTQSPRPFLNEEDLAGRAYLVALSKGKMASDGELAISKSSTYSALYAIAVLHGEFPAGEEMISRDDTSSFNYAKDALKAPFPKGENAISTNPAFSYAYAFEVLKGPFPKGEDIIAMNPMWSYKYAHDVLRGRFPKGEKTIMADPEWSKVYENDPVINIKALLRQIPKEPVELEQEGDIYAARSGWFTKMLGDEPTSDSFLSNRYSSGLLGCRPRSCYFSRMKISY